MIIHLENQKGTCPSCSEHVRIARFILEDGKEIELCKNCIEFMAGHIAAVKLKPIVFNKVTLAWEGLSAKEMGEWEETYGANTREELLKMVNWIIANIGDKRTNKRDWRRFIQNWLRRSADAKVKFNS